MEYCRNYKPKQGKEWWERVVLGRTKKKNSSKKRKKVVKKVRFAEHCDVKAYFVQPRRKRLRKTPSHYSHTTFNELFEHPNSVYPHWIAPEDRWWE